MAEYILIVLSFLLILSSNLIAQSTNWTTISDGLEIGRFKVEQKTPVGDSTITIVRVDPNYWDLKLLSASETGSEYLTTRQWCEKYNLAAAINAGMFMTDYQSNVGYMKNFEHLNNQQIHPEYQSVAAFNPKKSNFPPFKIFDIDEESIQDIITNYNTVIQNLRLIKGPGENRWYQQPKKWSEIALGQDKSGKVLFIFCRSPFSMHDFNNLLLKLPINIVCAQHLEGGPEAQLYLKYEDTKIEFFGSYETDFREDDSNDHSWPIPNVIGIIEKKEVH